ncbi:RpiB/LacA/LacB family sugar-phosphate isomerase [Jiella sp. MQZ9-1]|uniref:RpiB/LacA/LacB family sugar-phosphate isomerase n=1 Tax=Jiella flava TaxID=2816857 RepID=A0A939JVQ1_9HYPH|nr:RpiB/LacA/LacB family sugar-phosphate isomerase [Jiella flava]MBO0662212.1 RpiB/LacA/LacB family sugar-phosphate isomerase [Jiella flava]MCD2470958.1 RpiB/LacA/LacB family sugar-phosphate isomerase [Jiella flava]
MKIVIAGDSAGQPLVNAVADYLKTRAGVEFENLSPSAESASERYATMSERAVSAILDGRFDRGILCCGTGLGVCISANKVPGIRAALTHDTYSAERAAKSNNAQVITMGARVIGPELAKAIVAKYLDSEFDPASSSGPNVAAIDALDEKYVRNVG